MMSHISLNPTSHRTSIVPNEKQCNPRCAQKLIAANEQIGTAHNTTVFLTIHMSTPSSIKKAETMML